MVAEGIRNSLAISAARGSQRGSRCRSPSRWWRCIYEGKDPAQGGRGADDPRAEVRDRAVRHSPSPIPSPTVLILDFGSQFTQLIARRVRENRVYCEVHPFDLPLEEIRRRQPDRPDPLRRSAERLRARARRTPQPELFDAGHARCWASATACRSWRTRWAAASRASEPPRVRPGRDLDRPSPGRLFEGLVRLRDGVDEPRRPRRRACRRASGPRPAPRNVPGGRVRGPASAGSTASSSTPRSRTPSRAARSCATSSTASAARAATGAWPPTWRRRWPRCARGWGTAG